MDKSQIRISSLSLPLKSLSRECLDWSVFGLAALGAQNSVLLYKVNDKEIRYIRSIDLISTTVTAVKFHPIKPWLAIADDSSRIRLFSLEKGECIANTGQLMKNKPITSICWAENILIGLSPGAFLTGIDFFTSIQQGQKKKSTLWNIEMKGNHSSISLDPYHSFRCVLSDNNSNEFIIIKSQDPKTLPASIISQNLVGVTHVSDIIFHPHINDVLLILLPNRIYSYHIPTSSIKTLVEEQMSLSSYHHFLLTPFTHSDILVQHSDSTVTTYHKENKNFVKSGTLPIRKESINENPNIASVASPQYPNIYLCYSPLNGLVLFQSCDKLTKIISTTSFLPANITVYDTKDHFIGYGTKEGTFSLIDVMKNTISLKIQLDKFPIVDLKFLNENFIYWSSSKAAGSLNIESRIVHRFNSRKGTVQRLYVSDELCIAQRSHYAFDIITENNEKPVTLNKKIISIAAQTHRTPATCYGGDIPNFALLFDTREIYIYHARSTNPIMQLITPEYIQSPTSIAWQGNLLVICDSITGTLVLHDFEFSTSRKIIAFPDIKKIMFTPEDQGILVLSDDNKFGICLKDTKICPYQVKNFSVLSGGLVLVQLTDQSIEIIQTSDWKSNKTNVSPENYRLIASPSSRAKSLSLELLNVEDKTPEKLANLCLEKGYMFDGLLWSTIARYFGGSKELPLRFANFGQREEMKNSLHFRSALIEPSSMRSTLILMLLYVRLGDLESVSNVLLNLSQKSDHYVICCIAGALLKEIADEKAIETLRATGISLFGNGKYVEGCILLHLCHLDVTAAQYLQEHGEWRSALEILKICEMTDEIKQLIRKTCFHYFQGNKIEQAILLFASIGDFQPVLSLLQLIEKPVLNFHLLMYLDSIDGLKEYIDPSRQQSQYEDLDTLHQNIIGHYESFMASFA